MDLFEHRYYRLNKTFMALLGQWPCQNARTTRGISALIIFIAITGLPPPMFAFVKYRNDSDIFFECIIAGLFVTVGVVKFLSIVWNSQKILKLLNRVITSWQVWARCQEVKILHEYAQQGEQMLIAYTATIYATIVLFTIQPMIPKIIDIVLRNGTEIGKFPYPVDYYYFDAQKYYFYVNLHCGICASLVAMGLVASDGILIIYVQHGCGIFAALGFANLIEAIFTWSFFLATGLGMILINILGIQILLRKNEPESTIRYIAFAVALEVVFYVSCRISQYLMDHSLNILFYICNSQWYRLLPRDQKLLQMMILRCRICCELTAAKMLTLSMRNFGLTFRTFMSYFAVVRPQ